MKIDFVVPWVDGSDLEWQKQKELYTGVPQKLDDVRYRDGGIFKYWFRAVEQYAPWVNCIYLVTNGQIPIWLNRNHPQIRLVSHKEYIPEEYLPTFSSHPIELNFHRLPGLSEYFVYFNDDIFLNSPVSKEDFFSKGMPCLSAVLGEFTPTMVRDTFSHILCNDIAFMNAHFNKRTVVSRHPEKWFSLAYGKYVLKNLYYAFSNKHFSMIQNFHTASPMLKSTYEWIWENEYELLAETSCHKIRDYRDVNQYIMSYYQIGTGMFVPQDPRMGHYYEIGRKSDVLCDDIMHGRHKLICINDCVCDNFEEEILKVNRAFERKFPQKSAYEL